MSRRSASRQSNRVGIVDEREDIVRQGEIVHDRLADAPDRGERHQAAHDAARNEIEKRGVDADRHVRRMGRAREDVENVADAARVRIGQVEAAAVLPLEMGQMVERARDEIDRNQIDPPALQPDARHPRRQQPAHLLDQLEEVIRPVDLIHFAVAGISDHDAGPIDAPRQSAFVADDLLGFVLAGEIRVIQVLGFLEHVLAEHAFVEPGGRDRTDMVKALGADLLGEAHRIARALDIGRHFHLGVGVDRVDRSEMEHVIDRAFERV